MDCLPIKEDKLKMKEKRGTYENSNIPTKIFKICPFFKPIRSPSRARGPPITLMYQINDSSTHSLTFSPLKSYNWSFFSWHRMMWDEDGKDVKDENEEMRDEKDDEIEEDEER